MTSDDIVGWRLDLFRNCAEWKGSQVLVAKAEFFELIAKTELAKIPVSVYLCMDRHTSKKYYENWLEESGIALNELVTCLIIDIQYSEIENKTEYLNLWYDECRRFINEKTKDLNSAQDECPFWLAQHQQNQYDSILPIYF